MMPSEIVSKARNAVLVSAEDYAALREAPTCCARLPMPDAAQCLRERPDGLTCPEHALIDPPRQTPGRPGEAGIRRPGWEDYTSWLRPTARCSRGSTS